MIANFVESSDLIWSDMFENSLPLTRTFSLMQKLQELYAGKAKSVYLGHPEFEGFEVII